MKVELWVIGKTTPSYLQSGIEAFEKRIVRYLPFQLIVFPDVKQAKNLDATRLKHKEGELILRKLRADDRLILLDEKGKHFTSVAFSEHLNKLLQYSNRRLIFLIGGAYGFSPEVYAKASEKLALSEMTFSHQMVRLFFVEQLYRALSILKNEPYHNQ